MTEFNIGDVVQLNSGGPEMVVEGFEKKNGPLSDDGVLNRDVVSCRFFNQLAGKFEKGDFYSGTLSEVTTYSQETEKLKVGDTVMLNSEDSPEMTVYEILPATTSVSNGSGGFKNKIVEGDTYQARCMWWDTALFTYHREIFPNQSLVIQEN